MVKSKLNPWSLRVVIPSRGRSKIVGDRALSLFPYATVTVGESEMDDYAAMIPHVAADGRLIPHPDDAVGISGIRNWIQDNFDDEAIVMVDDDLHRIRSALGMTRGMDITHPDVAYQIVLNCANLAKAAGTSTFGFDQKGADVRKFKPQAPFLLSSYVGGVIGIIGRRHRWDEMLMLRADVDYCLQVLRDDRFIFIDERFCFIGPRFGLTGGNALNRTAERNQSEMDYLSAKWGKYLGIKQVKATFTSSIRVSRRQSYIRLASDG